MVNGLSSSSHVVHLVKVEVVAVEEDIAEEGAAAADMIEMVEGIIIASDYLIIALFAHDRMRIIKTSLISN